MVKKYMHVASYYDEETPRKSSIRPTYFEIIEINLTKLREIKTIVFPVSLFTIIKVRIHHDDYGLQFDRLSRI